jgi:hypothetical protein
MGKSIKVHQKKKVGRPATGRDPAVTVRLPSLSEVEVWATARGMSRSEAIRRLVELGLKAKAK